MSAAQESDGHQNTQKLPLKGIYINFEERAIEFEDQYGTVGRIVFTGERILVEGQPLTLAAPPEIAEQPPEPVDMSEPSPRPPAPEAASASRAVPELREKEPTVVLSGKLMSQPRQGNPDSRGKPTAWARFAAHVETEDDAHLYNATFHKHTAAIALGLAQDSPVTVEGYPHPSSDPTGKRLDTLSVINLVNYPGKQERPRRGRGTRA